MMHIYLDSINLREITNSKIASDEFLFKTLFSDCFETRILIKKLKCNILI